MADIYEYHGSLIAFEGSREILSTQCRLLPNSSNVLVLPELENFMEEDVNNSAFNPESYILRVHEACDVRAGRAYSFLKESTPTKRRLVFMIGGAASARVRCITVISEHYEIDIVKAEHLFNELTRDGTHGLRQAIEATPELSSRPVLNEMVVKDEEDSANYQDHALLNNPIYDAMRAAEALDRKTESLQLNTELDLTIATLRRSRSLPTRPLCDVPDTPSSGFSRASDDTIDESYSSDCSDEVYRSSALLTSNTLTPRTISFNSALATPVIIGEACLIDVRPLNSRFSSGRIKAVDYLYANTIRNQDVSLCDIHCSASARLGVEDRNAPTSQRKRISRSRKSARISRASPTSSKATGRRGPPSPLVLTRSNRRSSSYGQGVTNVRNDYVHHGTYTERRYIDRGSNTDRAEISPALGDRDPGSGDTASRAVLPMVEDMVIHFKDKRPDLLLERILHDLKEPKNEIDPAIRSPTSRQSMRYQSTRPEAGSGETEDPGSAPQPHADEYDPFASHGDYLRHCANLSERRRRLQAPFTQIQPSVPPTPTYTPPPQQVAPAQDKCFYELDISNCRTAVEIQDSVRSAICTYLSCRQPELSPGAEIGGDWQPVFRKGEADIPGVQKRNVDLILAIGAQECVEKEFSAALRGSLEKLGTKPKGITRSGRLDLRYLIVNAQRTWAAQPFPGQIPGDLSENPRLLATSVIPFLETYMAVHSDTGFLLLEYPPGHLATVLALQELIGDDLVKVAGILADDDDNNNNNNNNTDNLAAAAGPTRSHGYYGANKKGPETRAASLSLSAQRRPPSFSKANFVLTSSATESEIATFIAAVWRILVDRSPFYIPDGAPTGGALESMCNSQQQQQDPAAYESNSKPLAQSPLISSGIQYTPLDSAAAMMGFRDPAPITTTTATTTTPTRSSREAEEAPTIPPPGSGPAPAPRPAETTSKDRSGRNNNSSSRTAKDTRSHQKAKLRDLLGRDLDADDSDDKNKNRGRLPRPDTASSSSFFDLSDGDGDCDEDDRFAADERRYMPLFMRKKQEVRRGNNSRKALRFLGLSTGE